MSKHLKSVVNLIESSNKLSADEKNVLLNSLRNADREFIAGEREAKLELSLEKVRDKTMTMLTSSDVAETVALLFEEMIALGVKMIRCGIGIMRDNMEMEIWTSNAEARNNIELIVGIFDMNMHRMFQQARSSWENRSDFFSYDLHGDDLIAYYTAVNNMPGYKTKYNLDTVPKDLYHNSFHFNEGTLFVFSLEPLPEDICGICKRFAGVFGQTYRRFLDLKESEEQKKLVEEKHKETLDSINYAKRIQYTLLAHDKVLAENLSRHFVFFKPKDIVSGDFYWATRQGNKFYLAVCDSTGHGVPGAFMSLLNIGFLSEAIKEKNILSPNKIFDYVRGRLIETISKEGQKDGFDGILLCIEAGNKDETEIEYAAANNAPILICNNEIKELPCDKMPVGIGEKKDEFSNFKIKIQKGNSLFVYTDGYADQFGGEKGKKYKYKPLNEFLMSICFKEPGEQREMLDQNFTTWKGKHEQIDDVCVVGIKF